MNKTIDQAERKAAGAKVKRAVKVLASSEGMKMKQVAAESEIEYPQLYAKFSGKSPIELTDLERLASVFGRTVSEFLEVGDPMKPADLARRLATWNNASPLPTPVAA